MQPNITDNTNDGKQKETKLIEDDIANCCGKFNGECFFRVEEKQRETIYRQGQLLTLQ